MYLVTIAKLISQSFKKKSEAIKSNWFNPIFSPLRITKFG